jgi:hypothetical protein
MEEPMAKRKPKLDLDAQQFMDGPPVNPSYDPLELVKQTIRDLSLADFDALKEWFRGYSGATG